MENEGNLWTALLPDCFASRLNSKRLEPKPVQIIFYAHESTKLSASIDVFIVPSIFQSYLIRFGCSAVNFVLDHYKLGGACISAKSKWT